MNNEKSTYLGGGNILERPDQPYLPIIQEWACGGGSGNGAI